MLQIAAHKFHDMKLHGPPPIGFTLFIFKADPAIVDVNDAIVGDGYFEYVWSQVLDTSFTAADCLAVYNEMLFPHL